MASTDESFIIDFELTILDKEFLFLEAQEEPFEWIKRDVFKLKFILSGTLLMMGN